jgi:hypothetical protein
MQLQQKVITANSHTYRIFCEFRRMQLPIFVVFPLRHSLELRTQHSLGGPTLKNPTYSNRVTLRAMLWVHLDPSIVADSGHLEMLSLQDYNEAIHIVHEPHCC